MKRLLAGIGVGIVLGALATFLVMTLFNGGGGLPLRLEFELGERMTAALPVAAEATPIEAALPPTLNAIAEQRATSGSLLSGTLLAATDGASESEEFASALVKIAHEEEVKDLAAAPAPEIGPIAPDAAEPVSDVPTGVAAALEASAEKLYALAAKREEAMEFPRADQLRRLARRLRTESVAIQHEEHQADTRNLPLRSSGLSAPEEANPDQSGSDAN